MSYDWPMYDAGTTDMTGVIQDASVNTSPHRIPRFVQDDIQRLTASADVTPLPWDLTNRTPQLGSLVPSFTYRSSIYRHHSTPSTSASASVDPRPVCPITPTQSVASMELLVDEDDDDDEVDASDSDDTEQTYSNTLTQGHFCKSEPANNNIVSNDQVVAVVDGTSRQEPKTDSTAPSLLTVSPSSSVVDGVKSRIRKQKVIYVDLTEEDDEVSVPIKRAPTKKARSRSTPTPSHRRRSLPSPPFNPSKKKVRDYTSSPSTEPNTAPPSPATTMSSGASDGFVPSDASSPGAMSEVSEVQSHTPVVALRGTRIRRTQNGRNPVARRSQNKASQQKYRNKRNDLFDLNQSTAIDLLKIFKRHRNILPASVLSRYQRYLAAVRAICPNDADKVQRLIDG